MKQYTLGLGKLLHNDTAVADPICWCSPLQPEPTKPIESDSSAVLRDQTFDNAQDKKTPIACPTYLQCTVIGPSCPNCSLVLCT